MKSRIIKFTLTSALLMSPMVLYAGDWEISGSNTARVETYQSHGLVANSPYPFENGQSYDELNINFFKRDSAFEYWRGQVSVVLNASDYRHVDTGIVPERLSLVHEKGDGAIPYRTDLGDYFGYFSYLTLQRSLKGAQVELQPKIDGWGNRHSIVFLAGENDFRWKDVQIGDDFTTGVSWLVEGTGFGTVNFNLLHNSRESDSGLGTLDRDQMVMSVGLEKELAIADHKMTLEVEIAHMNGDHNGTTGALSGQDQSGNGQFAELTGRHLSMPLDYRVRAEYYDKDFLPAGSIVSADRRTLELHSGWRFDTGLRLRGRYLDYTDGVDSAIETDTRTVGVNLSGPFDQFSGWAGVTGNVDAFIQEIENDTRTIESKSWTVDANLNKSLNDGWFGRLGLFMQHFEDQTVTDADVLTGQVTFSADHAFAFSGFEGAITPGLQLRFIDDTGDSRDWNPTLAIHLNRGPHSVDMSYGYSVQDRRFVGGVDTNIHSMSADYSYRTGQSVFGVELDFFDRGQSHGEETDAYVISLFWTYEFDNKRSRSSSLNAVGGAALLNGDLLTVDLFSLSPNVLVSDATAALTRDQIGNGTIQGNLRVYEYPLLDGISQRQRLVLEDSGGVLTASALIIEFDNVGGLDTAPQLFERVRKELMKKYGAPSSNFELGDFTGSYKVDVNSKKLIRVYEWQTPQGVLRLGLPRRLDRQVRIEIQHRSQFSSPRDTLWSMEAIR